MVFNLDPLDIDLEFERKTYRLGDTIRAIVTMYPSGSVSIRGATINLVAEVKRTEVKAGWAYGVNESRNQYGGSSGSTCLY